jgi:hypothetical protein
MKIKQNSAMADESRPTTQHIDLLAGLAPLKARKRRVTTARHALRQRISDTTRYLQRVESHVQELRVLLLDQISRLQNEQMLLLASQCRSS